MPHRLIRYNNDFPHAKLALAVRSTRGRARWREHLFGPDLRGDDLLAVGVLDERLEGRAVRCEAQGQGVTTANQLLVLQNETVIGRGRPGCGEALQVELLRRLEGAQQLRCDPGMLREHRVLDHDETVDRKNSRPPVPLRL